MASHNRTPRTVLEAPTRTEEWISEQRGFSRDEIRNGVRPHPSTARLDPHARAALERTSFNTARRAGKNVPYEPGRPQTARRATAKPPGLAALAQAAKAALRGRTRTTQS